MVDKHNQNKPMYDKILDLLVFIAVFVVTIFLILEVLPARQSPVDTALLNNIYMWVNLVVLVIFVADLLRIWSEAEGFGHFLKEGWLDLLATIPFGLIGYALGGSLGLGGLSILKIARVEKLMKASKIGKEFKAASHLKKESEEYKKKHRV